MADLLTKLIYYHRYISHVYHWLIWYNTERKVWIHNFCDRLLGYCQCGLTLTLILSINLASAIISDCSPSILGFRIEKFVISGYSAPRFGIRLTDWYPRLTYFMHYDIVDPDGRYIQTVGSDDDCQNTN